MQYGQFCPIAKAAELLGDRWTLLIVREILMGARQFNELQRGLGSISTSVLTQRLKALAENGLIVKRRSPGRRGSEYHPSPSCKELQPIILALGGWGMRWAKDNLVDEDYDVELLMLYLERSVARDMLPGPRTVLQFDFKDLKSLKRWWLIVSPDRVEVCEKDPGQDVDVFFSTTVRTMTDVWLGHRSYREAVKARELLIVGEVALTRSVHKWLVCTTF